jgi:hypothetical protein
MISHATLRAYRESISAPWFVQPWDINLFVARDGVVGTWGDLVIAACKDDANREVTLVLSATGDAWGGEWTNPTNPKGCVFTLDGHYGSGLILGEHKGRPALRQNAPFRYVRWPRTSGHVPSVTELEALPSFVGIAGTHVHNRAGDRTPDVPATDDSEGCTVLLYQHEHAALIRLVGQQLSRRGTATVSPTFCKRTALGI